MRGVLIYQFTQRMKGMVPKDDGQNTKEKKGGKSRISIRLNARGWVGRWPVGVVALIVGR